MMRDLGKYAVIPFENSEGSIYNRLHESFEVAPRIHSPFLPV